MPQLFSNMITEELEGFAFRSVSVANQLGTGGIRSSLKPSVLNAERLGKLNNEESTPIVSIPFKVTRDYTSGDASEGFED